MASPRYELLRSRELRAALMALGDIAEAADSSMHFAQAGVQALSRLVPGELTTLSRCDLQSAKRTVVGTAQACVGAAERAAFDRHFHEHPLVQYHAVERGAFAHRISDSLSQARFRQTALYNDYYRRVGLSHALALPVRMDGRELVSFVLNRQGHDFSDGELALLDTLRRPLARLFDRVDAAERPAPALDNAVLVRLGLTRRESEVLQWVAAGKTDKAVAALLGCSPRTVHKHLQRIYAKLGVETRTAAVMRALQYD
jgi:DNA-binding CsgD family transcriptional regulator